MTDDERGVALIAAFLLIWYWQRGRADVSLKQTCVFPDGTEVLVPLGDPCPCDDAHGGCSHLQTEVIN